MKMRRKINTLAVSVWTDKNPWPHIPQYSAKQMELQVATRAELVVNQLAVLMPGPHLNNNQDQV